MTNRNVLISELILDLIPRVNFSGTLVLWVKGDTNFINPAPQITTHVIDSTNTISRTSRNVNGSVSRVDNELIA